MDTAVRTETSAWTDSVSAVSWSSIAAGAIVAAAVSLALFALGAGLGLATVSPWADSGVSAATFRNATGIYLVIVAVMSSAIGGYLAARLRTKWTGIHTHEVFLSGHGPWLYRMGVRHRPQRERPCGCRDPYRRRCGFRRRTRSGASIVFHQPVADVRGSAFQTGPGSDTPSDSSREQRCGARGGFEALDLQFPR
jgi:hypothetical protein